MRVFGTAFSIRKNDAGLFLKEPAGLTRIGSRTEELRELAIFSGYFCCAGGVAGFCAGAG
jgi:hypothetical protein